MDHHYYIRPVDEQDLYKLLTIRNEVYSNLRQVNLCSPQGQKDWFRSLHGDSSRYVFSIVDSYNEVVGSCSILGINSFKTSAEVGWFLEKEYQHKGIGTYVIPWILKFAFNQLNLESVVAYVYSDNEAGNKFALKLGFKKVGEFHNVRRRGNTFIHENIYELLRGDYFK